MENYDRINLIMAGLAALVFVGAILMMFTSFWTDSGKKKSTIISPLNQEDITKVEDKK